MHFIYLLHPNKKNFNETINDEERKIISDHFNYLKRLLEEGKLVLAGPTLDATFGISIFEAENEESAKTIMQNDPAIQKNVMTAELYPFRISLMKK